MGNDFKEVSTIIGSFERKTKLPIEAQYIFPTYADLVNFYEDNPEWKLNLHKGLLKIVENDGFGNQALYWVTPLGSVTAEDPELRFEQIPTKIDFSEMKAELKATVGMDDPEDDDIITYLTTLPEDFRNLTEIAVILDHFLRRTDPDIANVDIKTWPDLLAFLDGYKKDEKLHTIIDNIQQVINQTIAGAGLQPSTGAYVADETTNYLKEATSITNALKLLDGVVKSIDRIYEAVNVDIVPITITTDDEKVQIGAKLNLSTETGNILLRKDDGLFSKIELEYVGSNLSLIVNGVRQPPIPLGISFLGIKDVTYDPLTESLLITFSLSDGTERVIRVDLSQLIRQWDVDNNGSSVELTLVQDSGVGKDILSANAKIATAANNILVKRPNGSLYVKGETNNIKHGTELLSDLVDSFKAGIISILPEITKLNSKWNLRGAVTDIPGLRQFSPPDLIDGDSVIVFIDGSEEGDGKDSVYSWDATNAEWRFNRKFSAGNSGIPTPSGYNKFLKSAGDGYAEWENAMSAEELSTGTETIPKTVSAYVLTQALRPAGLTLDELIAGTGIENKAISASVFTTYYKTGLTAADLTTGTATDNKTVSAKTLVEFYRTGITEADLVTGTDTVNKTISAKTLYDFAGNKLAKNFLDGHGDGMTLDFNPTQTVADEIIITKRTYIPETGQETPYSIPIKGANGVGINLNTSVPLSPYIEIGIPVGISSDDIAAKTSTTNTTISAKTLTDYVETKLSKNFTSGIVQDLVIDPAYTTPTNNALKLIKSIYNPSTGALTPYNIILNALGNLTLGFDSSSRLDAPVINLGVIADSNKLDKTFAPGIVQDLVIDSQYTTANSLKLVKSIKNPNTGSTTDYNVILNALGNLTLGLGGDTAAPIINLGVTADSNKLNKNFAEAHGKNILLDLTIDNTYTEPNGFRFYRRGLDVLANEEVPYYLDVIAEGNLILGVDAEASVIAGHPVVKLNTTPDATKLNKNFVATHGSGILLDLTIDTDLSVNNQLTLIKRGLNVLTDAETPYQIDVIAQDGLTVDLTATTDIAHPKITIKAADLLRKDFASAAGGGIVQDMVIDIPHSVDNKLIFNKSILTVIGGAKVDYPVTIQTTNGLTLGLGGTQAAPEITLSAGVIDFAETSSNDPDTTPKLIAKSVLTTYVEESLEVLEEQIVENNIGGFVEVGEPAHVETITIDHVGDTPVAVPNANFDRVTLHYNVDIQVDETTDDCTLNFVAPGQVSIFEIPLEITGIDGTYEGDIELEDTDPEYEAKLEALRAPDATLELQLVFTHDEPLATSVEVEVKFYVPAEEVSKVVLYGDERPGYKDEDLAFKSEVEYVNSKVDTLAQQGQDRGTVCNALAPQTYYKLTEAVASEDGVDYEVGDILSIPGEPGDVVATLEVTAVGEDGAIGQFTVVNAGHYISDPSATILVTGGHGTGAEIMCDFTAYGSYRLTSATINNPGENYVAGDALFVLGTNDDINAIIIVNTVEEETGAIVTASISKPGDYLTDESGEGITVLGGHGAYATFDLEFVLEPNSVLRDLVNPQPNDRALVVADELHGGNSYWWIFADYNGDGTYNWVPLAPNNISAYTKTQIDMILLGYAKLAETNVFTALQNFAAGARYSGQ